jgi:hypothetical protein
MPGGKSERREIAPRTPFRVFATANSEGRLFIEMLPSIGRIDQVAMVREPNRNEALRQPRLVTRARSERQESSRRRSSAFDRTHRKKLPSRFRSESNTARRNAVALLRRTACETGCGWQERLLRTYHWFAECPDKDSFLELSSPA